MLARYDETVAALAAVLEDLEPAGWDVLAEAPPGHIAVRAVVAHALWDSLIHERDVVLPLGLEPVIEPDELALSLRYAAALGPAFQAAKGGTRCGTLAVEATEPDMSFVVEASPDVVVRDGPASAGARACAAARIDLLEMLSFPCRSTMDWPPTTAGSSAASTRCSTSRSPDWNEAAPRREAHARPVELRC